MEWKKKHKLLLPFRILTLVFIALSMITYVSAEELWLQINVSVDQTPQALSGSHWDNAQSVTFDRSGYTINNITFEVKLINAGACDSTGTRLELRNDDGSGMPSDTVLCNSSDTSWTSIQTYTESFKGTCPELNNTDLYHITWYSPDDEGGYCYLLWNFGANNDYSGGHGHRRASLGAWGNTHDGTDSYGISVYIEATSVPPVVTLVTPIDNDHARSQTFNFTVDQGIDNCSLNLNGVLNQTQPNNNNFTVSMTGEQEFNWSINCTNTTTGLGSSLERTFFYDDVNPIWTIRSINTTNTTKFDREEVSSILFNDSAFDTYLFAFNITAFYPNGSIWWNNYTLDLNISTLNFVRNESITATQPNGTYSIRYSAEDDHTALEIPHYGIEITQQYIQYNTPTNVILLESVEGNLDITTNKLIDRYTFDIDWGNNRQEHEITLWCDDDLYYRGNLYPYPVFVCGKNWIDFNVINSQQSNIDEIIVTRISNDKFNINVKTLQNTRQLSFESLGGLNTRTEVYQFQISENVPPNITSTQPTGDFSIDDGQTIQFNVTASDFDNDTISYSYYYDGVLESGVQNYSWLVPFASHGLHNMTVFAIDTADKNDSFTWVINVTHSNEGANVTNLVRTPLTTWYSNIVNTAFVCSGVDLDNETPIANLTTEIEYRTGILWAGLSVDNNLDGTFRGNISISALEGNTIDVRCRISDDEDTTDWFVVNNIVTVANAYAPPGNITKITPSNSKRDFITSVTCRQEDYGTVRSYALRYDIDVMVNNSGNWENISNTFNSKALFDMTKVAYGENVKFRCAVTDGTSITDFFNGSNVTRTHITDVFMFGGSSDEVKTKNTVYYKGIMADLHEEPNVTIVSSFADCNGDGFWDYYFDYDDSRNTTKEYFACYNAPGVVIHSVGIFIEKTGVNNRFCGERTDGLCRIERNYEVLIK